MFCLFGHAAAPASRSDAVAAAYSLGRTDEIVKRAASSALFARRCGKDRGESREES
jgi:hypothetical protein